MSPGSIVLTVLAASLQFQEAVLGCMEGDVRLTGGADNTTGRVEFCHEEEWGTVCDAVWDEDDARVVCRQLGLPTKAVAPLRGFGGGSGIVLFDDTHCNGSEHRLEDCPRDGIGNHDCDDSHNEDAGVICFPDEDICQLENISTTLQVLEHCNDSTLLLEPSQACLHRHGFCVPFYPTDIPTMCDNVYEPGVDFVYVPYTRSGGKYSDLIKDMSQFALLLNQPLATCDLPVDQLLCHYYLPPCGNVTHYEPPTAVCPEVCNIFVEQCPNEWVAALDVFKQSGQVYIEDGLQFINCSSPGQHLAPLPYCCTDAGLNITLKSPHVITNDDYGFVLYISIGLALFVLTLLIAIPVLLVAGKRYLKPKRMTISAPVSFHKRTIKCGSLDIVIDHAPTIKNRYTFDVMSTLKSPSNIPRVPSGFIRQMTEDKMLVPEENINLISVIGQGEFGVVYRTTLSNWKEYSDDVVAVKTLKGMFTTSDLNNLVEESQIMTKFNHLNVMRLLGVTISQSKSLLLIMPFMAQGSLLSYLRKHRADLTVGNEQMTELIEVISSKLLTMCLQIAKGMAYLASQRFVHRDLAARNCMIDANDLIKVSDFGLSEDVYSRNYFRQLAGGEDKEASVKLPVRWMALESLNDGIFSEKTDVWSFGVTCWEVFSLGKNPYPGIDPFSLVRYLERGERLEKPLNAACSQEIYKMMRQCWEKEPEKRLTFSELMSVISTSLEDITGYMDMDLTTPADNTLSADVDDYCQMN